MLQLVRFLRGAGQKRPAALRKRANSILHVVPLEDRREGGGRAAAEPSAWGPHGAVDVGFGGLGLELYIRHGTERGGG